jgi:D,D-heptose 1,7-bisphosphate phosphatase
VAQPAVFLDRDGTLMIDHGFVGDPAQVELLPGVATGLRRLQAAGYRLLVISNQSGVARGYFDLAAVAQVEAELTRQLTAQDVTLAGFFVCPHLDDGCDCRKPLPGLLVKAAASHDIDLSRSVMIGDRGSDVAAGQAAGMPGLLVLTGALAYVGPVPSGVFADLAGAADWILSHGA